MANSPDNQSNKNDKNLKKDGSARTGTSSSATPENDFSIAGLNQSLRGHQPTSSVPLESERGVRNANDDAPANREPTPPVSVSSEQQGENFDFTNPDDVPGWDHFQNKRPPSFNDQEIPDVPGFKIIRRIGADGQGAVYLAEEEALHRHVALKIPRLDRHASTKTLMAEAHALAKVRHPNVVSIYRIGMVEDLAFFSMEYIEGIDLAKFLDLISDEAVEQLEREDIIACLKLDETRLARDVRTALSNKYPYYPLVSLWMAHAADGLAAAQAASVLHRDIKPSNLIIASDGRLVVADFGLARFVETTPSPNATGVTGTYPYICPERAAGDWVRSDHRADVWSLGATMYEMLTGTRAYSGKGKEVLIQIATTAPKRPRKIRKSVPRGLDSICMKAMNRSPDDRFQTWHEFSERLRNMSAEDSNIPRSGRTLTVVALVAFMFLATVGSVGYSYWTKRLSNQNSSSDHLNTANFSNPVAPPKNPAVNTEEKVATGANTEQEIEESVPGETKTLSDYDNMLAAGDGPIGAHGEPGAIDQPHRNNEPPPSVDAATAQTIVSPSEQENQDNTPPVAVEPMPVRLMVAFNEDLNTRDEFNKYSGGQAQSLCSKKLKDLIGNKFVKSALTVPDVWTDKDAIEAGQAIGATHVLFAQFNVRMGNIIEDLDNMEGSYFDWKLTLEASLIDLETMVPTAISVEPQSHIARAIERRGVKSNARIRMKPNGVDIDSSTSEKKIDPAREYSGNGDKVKTMAYELARNVIAELPQDRLEADE